MPNKYFIISCTLLVCFVYSRNPAQSNFPETGKAPLNYKSSANLLSDKVTERDTFCLTTYIYDATQSAFYQWGGCPPGGFLSYWTPLTIAHGGVRGGDGNYYFLDTGPPTTLCKLDTTTGNVTLIGEITGMGTGASAKGIAFDPVNYSYYLCGGSSTNNLYQLDINTLTATLVSGIGNPNGVMIAITISSAGVGYGYDITNDMAYTFDPVSGSSTQLGYIGFDANYAQDMDYDMSTGTIYLAAFNNSTGTGQLRTMDPNTGSTSLIYDIVDQITVFEFNNYYPPVPVELTSFSARILNGETLLEWETATETNNEGFEVQRSGVRSRSVGNELKIWKAVGFVAGKGTTTEEQQYHFTDTEVPEGNYIYRLKQIDFDGEFKYSEELNVEVRSGRNYHLFQNYPNPFNPVTVISYYLPEKSLVSLEIFNVLGQKINTLVNKEQESGNHKVNFDAGDFPSGIYLYKLNSGRFTEIRKMLLVK